MPRTYRVRPNPVGSFIGGIVGIGVLIFGLRNFGIDDGGFVLLWVVVAVGIILANFYNAFSKRGIANEIIETPDEDRPAVDSSLDPAARLRRLETLRQQGLLTATEYDQRRAEILRQL